MFEVEVTTQNNRRLAGMAHKGAYDGIGVVFQKLATLASQRNLWSASVNQMAGVYHDDPASVAEADLRSHAAIVIPADMDLPQGLEEVKLPAGKFAVLHYKGPYAGIKNGWDHLGGKWLPSSGEKLVKNGACFELYLNDPASTPEADLLTDIYIQLEA